MGNSKSIHYATCDEGVKSSILSEFIKIYSDKNITFLSFTEGNYSKNDKDNSINYKEYEVYLEIPKIYNNKSRLIFKNKSQLIEFVEKLGRPFIIMGETLNDRNTIYFVYGSK
jgi:hypothetical protein